MLGFAAILGISPWPPNRPTYGTAWSAMVEIKFIHFLFYSCYLFYMPNPFRNLGLAQVGPGFVRGSQLCIHSTCGKSACNQKYDAYEINIMRMKYV